MIRYSWKVLVKESKGNKVRLLKIIKALVEYSNTEGALAHKHYPRYILNCIYTKEKRSSFLLNPEKLLNNTHKHTDSEVLLYLKLASMRNYMDFKLRNEIDIPNYYIEDIYNLDKLRLCNIVDVNDKVVRLKYERE